MDAATSRDSVAAFMQDVLAGSGWEVSKIRRRSTRLEPPDSYWALFSVDINKDEEERNLRLVTKGALNDEAWDRLSARLARDGNGKVCDPVDGLGYPVLFHETQHAYWFYPYDPAMTNLKREWVCVGQIARKGRENTRRPRRNLRVLRAKLRSTGQFK